MLAIRVYGVGFSIYTPRRTVVGMKSMRILAARMHSCSGLLATILEVDRT